MAKKVDKRRAAEKDDVAELVALAERLNLPVDALEGDVRDAAESAAELAAETAMEGGLAEQINFLLDNGFQPGRLGELIKEYALTQET